MSKGKRMVRDRTKPPEPAGFDFPICDLKLMRTENGGPRPGK